MTKYFAFIQGMKEPEPQIFHDEVPKTGSGKPKLKYLFGPLKLEGEDAALSLDELALKYQGNIISHE